MLGNIEQAACRFVIGIETAEPQILQLIVAQCSQLVALAADPHNQHHMPECGREQTRSDLQETVEVVQDEVILRHAYVERRVKVDPDLWVLEFEAPDLLPPFEGEIV